MTRSRTYVKSSFKNVEGPLAFGSNIEHSYTLIFIIQDHFNLSASTQESTLAFEFKVDF